MVPRLALLAVTWLLPTLAACDFAADSCTAGVSCMANPESGRALMQRKIDGVRATLRPTPRRHRKRHPHSKATHALAAEMQHVVSTQGPSGLDEKEKEHIESIKDVIVEDILPDILDVVEENRQEIDLLYQAVVNCTVRLNQGLSEADLLENTTESRGEKHKKCRKNEDSMATQKKEACSDLDEAMIGINPPTVGFELSMEMSDEQMKEYLRLMEAHYCGRESDFKDSMDECDDADKNHTSTGGRCDDLQQDFEEAWCTWKVDLEATCTEFDRCWEAAVRTFNDRKGEIEGLQETRISEYVGAVKVKCLWDAWDVESSPCTINETRAKECEDDPDLTPIRIDFPVLPPEPSCSTQSVSMHPCTDDFVASQYISIGVSEDLVSEMREGCSACPDIPSPEGLDDSDGLDANLLSVGFGKHSHVLRHLSGGHKQGEQSRMVGQSGVNLVNTMFMHPHHVLKSGGSGCDGVVDTKFDIAGMSVQMMEVASKAKVEFATKDSSSVLELDNGVAMVAGKVTDYNNNDWISVGIRGGQLIFAKNSVPFATFSAGSAQKGHAKLIMCTLDSTMALHLVGAQGGQFH